VCSSDLSPVLRIYRPAGIEEVKQHTQKERRIIDTLEPVLNRHRLVVDKDLIENDIRSASDTPTHSLVYQMTRLTKDRGALKHDDYIDVLAIAVKYWMDSMARDQVTAAIDYREKLLDEDLKFFLEHAISNPGVHNTVSISSKYRWTHR
jgi:hypothetical protein